MATLHSTAKIVLSFARALTNAPSADDPQLPGIAILNYDAAKLDREINSLPNLHETVNIVRRLIEQLRSLKTTSAQDQAALFVNQLGDTKKNRSIYKSKNGSHNKTSRNTAKIITKSQKLIQKICR